MLSKTDREGENYFATREEDLRELGVQFTLATRLSDSSDPSVDKRPIPQMRN